MNCARCTKEALRVVGAQGFCRAHALDANRLQAEVIARMDKARTEVEDWQRARDRQRRYHDERFRSQQR